jgi:transcriptional regulator with XRE-family HTH domain
MREMGLTYTLLAAKTGITRQSLSDFMRDRTWPQDTTLTRIDQGLEWDPGTIAGIALSGVAPGGPSTPRNQRMIDWPDDLDSDEDAYLHAAVKLLVMERTREIRTSRRI